MRGTFITPAVGAALLLVSNAFLPDGAGGRAPQQLAAQERHAADLDLQTLRDMPECRDILDAERFELTVFQRRFREPGDNGNDEQLVDEFLEFAETVSEFDLRSLYELPEFQSVVDQERFEQLLERQRARSIHLTRQMVWTRPVVRRHWHLWRSGRREFNEDFIQQTLAGGFRPAFLAAWLTESGVPRYTTVWVRDNRQHRIELALTRREFAALNNRSLQGEMQLVSVEEYEVGQSTRYAALWVRQETPAPWQLRERLSERETARLSGRLTSEGFRASFVNAYDDGTLTTVWVKDGSERRLLLGLTDPELRRLETERAHDCLPVCIDSHFDQRRRYCVIIDEAVDGAEWRFVRPDLRHEGTLTERRNAGWMPIMTCKSRIHSEPAIE